MDYGQDSKHVLTRRSLLKYGLYGGAATVVSGGLSLNSCSHKRDKQKANVLLISLDTVRRDHCSVYGYKHDTTPNLTQLAKQGALFDMAYAPSSTTGPSHATMFTSLYPVTHRLVKNGLGLADKYETLTEILKANGYQTAAVVGSFVLHSKFGLAQGFDFFDDNFADSEGKADIRNWEGHQVQGGFDRRANYTTERAIHWLKNERNSTEPFFMFVHYFDPHNPYLPLEPFKSMFAPTSDPAAFLHNAVGRYDAEIAFTDKYVGDLVGQIDRMGLKNNTLIIIVSDHGEGLGQHGVLYHGPNVYEEAVRVPMIFRFPERIKKHTVFNEPVELVDLAPTILDLVNIGVQDYAFQGQNLTSALCSRTRLDSRRPIYLYRPHYLEMRIDDIWVKGEKFAVKVGKWKYIEGHDERTKELYDLEADPGEHRNLYSDTNKIATSLAGHLQEWKQAHIGNASVPARIAEEDLQKLKTLGYVE